MYTIFMLIAVPILAIAWIAYALWERKLREEERSRPKPQSQRLVQTKTEVADWAKKMAEFQAPKPKKTWSDEGTSQDQTNKPGN